MRINLKAKMLILLSVIISLLTGCSASKDANGLGLANDIVESNSSRDSVAVIKYAQWSFPMTDVVGEAIKEYNETNRDNVQVELMKIPRSRYNDTINMLLSSGEGPDVFEARREWLFSYIYKNWLYDLSDEVDESFLNNFPEWVKNFVYGKFVNHLYSIPSNQVTYRLIYNKDLFKRAGLDPEKPPKTLEQLVSYSKKITSSGVGDRIYGFALPANDIWSGFIQPMEAVSYFSNAYYYDFKKGKYNLDVYQPWLNTLMNLKENGIIFPGEMTLKEDLALLQFAEGNVGMMFAQSWMPVMLQQLFQTKCNWAVALPPVMGEVIEGQNYIGMDASGWQVINSKTARLDESVIFWKYLYSYQYNSELYKEECALPIIKGIIEKSDNQPDVLYFDKFLPSKWDKIYPTTPLDIDEISRANVYSSIFNGLLPLESGLVNESYRLNMLLDKYSITGKVNINDYTDSSVQPSTR